MNKTDRSSLSMNVSRFLKRVRQNRKKTQMQVAKELGCGVVQSAISRAESGAVSMTLDWLNCLLTLYKLTEDEKRELMGILSASISEPGIRESQGSLIKQLSALPADVRSTVVCLANSDSPHIK